MSRSKVFTVVRQGKLICTRIFPCLVCVNRHATARPHSRRCQAEQAIIWVALHHPPPPALQTMNQLSVSHFDLPPSYETYTRKQIDPGKHTLSYTAHTYITDFTLHRKVIGSVTSRIHTKKTSALKPPLSLAHFS